MSMATAHREIVATATSESKTHGLSRQGEKQRAQEVDWAGTDEK